jgi:hypothetical protein
MITVHSAIVNNSWDSNPRHFKEDDVRVKRSRFRSVILLQECHPERSEGSRAGLFPTAHIILYCSSRQGDRKGSPLLYTTESACPLRGRFLLRPLEEPLRTGHARRGGGGVDEAGGRLRRPGPPNITYPTLPTAPIRYAAPQEGFIGGSVAPRISHHL